MKRFIAILLAVGMLVAVMALPAAAAPKNKGTTYIDPSPLTESVLQGVSKLSKDIRTIARGY